MPLIGYARVSTRDQNAALRRDALRAVDCARIFEETASGASRDRAELAAAQAIGRKCSRAYAAWP